VHDESTALRYFWDACSAWRLIFSAKYRLLAFGPGWLF
jgi:hypothetical protein